MAVAMGQSDRAVPVDCARPAGGVVAARGAAYAARMTMSASATRRPFWLTAVRVLLGLLPLWILLLELVTVPRTLDLAGANPPAIAGLPFGILLIAAALMIMAVGVVVVGRSRPILALLGFILFTVPATLLMIVGPVLPIALLWGM
jgi:hypothetical protein